MPNLEPASLNYLAIGAAGIASFLLGAVWYTALFGKAWQRLNGYSDDQLKAMQAARPMPVFFGGLLLCYVLSALAIALVARWSGAQSAVDGLGIGVAAWLLVAAFGMTGHLANAKPLGAFLIDAGFALVYLPVTGLIVGAWR